MMDEDIEMMPDDGEVDSLWLRRAIQWQNRCFAFAATVLVATSIVYAVGGFYASKSETPIIDYDAHTGEVGNGATNSKIQEALDSTKHKSGNAASAWWQQHAGDSDNPFDGNDGNPKDIPGWYVHKNMTHKSKAWDAAKERWNRTHPGVPFPYQDGSTPSAPDGSSENKPGAVPEDYSAWLAAEVTLDSGTMYEVVGKLPHDSNAFTEGLTFTPLEGTDGVLYESTGLHGQSKVKRMDPVTGEVLDSVKMDSLYFGEGLTYLKGKLVQLTWQSKTGFVYNASNLTIPPESFKFKTTKNEGWGLTYDEAKDELIVSDGSSNLHFWNSTTFKQVRKVKVTRLSGQPAKDINELEFWRGRVLANVWYQDIILVINPETGVVEKEYDFQALRHDYKPGGEVLNGISVSSDPNVLYITGKQWSTIFRVKLLP